MEGGGALAALQAMKAHPREVAVQVCAPLLQEGFGSVILVFRDFSLVFLNQILVGFEGVGKQQLNAAPLCLTP